MHWPDYKAQEVPLRFNAIFIVWLKNVHLCMVTHCIPNTIWLQCVWVIRVTKRPKNSCSCAFEKKKEEYGWLNFGYANKEKSFLLSTFSEIIQSWSRKVEHTFPHKVKNLIICLFINLFTYFYLQNHPPEKYKFRCIPKKKRERKKGTMASSSTGSKELINKIKEAIIIIIITIIIQWSEYPHS